MYKSKLENEIINIINENLKKYKYKDIETIDLKIEKIKQDDRIQIHVNYGERHILDLCLWMNGKISDNFTVNDFKKYELLLYNTNNVYYYLLPLDLLVKTTLYVITDYFELRNFNKCIKYLDRVKFINDINDEYSKQSNNDIVDYILLSYKNKIKRKYKMIYDYPFIIAYYLHKKNNGIIKCVYDEIRHFNEDIMDMLINTIKEVCKDEEDYKNSENSYNEEYLRNNKMTSKEKNQFMKYLKIRYSKTK